MKERQEKEPAQEAPKKLAPVYVEGKTFVPTVVLDQEKGEFSVSGEAYMYASTSFFAPLLAWLDLYAEAPNPETVLEFKMSYFNSGVSKLLFEMMVRLVGVPGYTIVWYYREGDADIYDSGEEFMEDLAGHVVFELRPYKAD